MDSVLQLHGLIEKNAPKKPAAPAHQRVAFDSFDALISPYTLATNTEDVAPDLLSAAALMHHRILLAYCGDHAVLPMRFGSVFSSRSALKAAMAEQAESSLAALRQLGDHREYAVQLIIESGPAKQTAQQTSGRAFLNQRQHLRDRRRDRAQSIRTFAQSLHAELDSLSAQPPHAGPPKPERALDVHVLIPKSDAQRLRALASSVLPRATELGVSLSVTGPWPAYHFDAALMHQSQLAHVS